MKLAFSTLACPDASWRDIYSMASDLGFDGIEVRGLGEDIFAVRARPFTEGELPRTLETLRSLNLSIPCFSSDCCLRYGGDQWEQTKADVVSYIRLAARTGTPFIRILGDHQIEPDGPVDDDAVAARLRELAPIAQEHGVTLPLCRGDPGDHHSKPGRLYQIRPRQGFGDGGRQGAVPADGRGRPAR